MMNRITVSTLLVFIMVSLFSAFPIKGSTIVVGQSPSQTSKVYLPIMFQAPLAEAKAMVPFSGGQLSVPNFATVIFSPGTFATDQLVEVVVTNDNEKRSLFTETSPLFGVGARPPYEIVINTGIVQPQKDIQVTFIVPQEFRASIPADSEVRVLAQNLWSDADEQLDTYELFDPKFPTSASSITLVLPPWIFTSQRNQSQTFEAVLTLGTTPTAPNTLSSNEQWQQRSDEQTGTSLIASDQSAQTCEAASLAPPLDGELRVTSPYGPRKSPTPGASSFHSGTDLAASQGTPVKSMADGTIETITVQRKNGQIKGWGQYIVVKHTDGSRSLYAHLTLNSATKSVGAKVAKGDVIAKSGNTGVGTGPHLHVEYAPSGRIYQKDAKIDPFPCIGSTVSGSVTIRDNGTLADDAFNVLLNGVLICQTSIGASNTCAISNLRPGTATLTLVAVTAPDNVATYQISLANGLKFQDGTTTKSGTLPQGGSQPFSIVIPNP